MKKTMCIVVILLIISCAGESKSMKYEDASVEMRDGTEFDNLGTKIDLFSLEILSAQKLQDYFELFQLQQQHPEFKEDILLQLKAFSKDSILEFEASKEFTIKNIRSANNAIKLSDSVQKMKLYYDIVSENKVKTDSIYAFITTKSVMIDSQNTVSTKVTFSN